MHSLTYKLGPPRGIPIGNIAVELRCLIKHTILCIVIIKLEDEINKVDA